MRESDLDEVMRIEEECFRFPWKRLFFAEDLRRPTSCLLVAREDGPGRDTGRPDGTRAGRLAGYVVMWIVADELHLANIAVDPSFRRQGVGSALLCEVLESARESGCRCVYLEVRAGNAVALAFYRKHGFVHSYTRRGYYPDREDALIMVKEVRAGDRGSGDRAQGSVSGSGL